MTDENIEQQLLALIGYHARTVRRGFKYPDGALFAQVKACPVCCGPMDSS